MAGNATCHCGHVVEPRDPDPWEGRMDDYCYDCATNRCDCYPDECPVKYPQASSAASPSRRIRMDLSKGHMDVSVAPDVSAETLDALRSVGEAALKRMEEPVSDLIGKKATIVGYSETGDGDGRRLPR